MKRLILLCAATLVSVAAFALPTTEQVQEAVKAGNYTQAETMMQEVVAAKPKSARAHYVYAEILAHDGKFSDAAAQARAAREADPAIGFTDPAKFRTFEQELQREQAGPAVRSGVNAPVNEQTQIAPARAEAPSAGIPGWVWGLGVAVVLFLVFRSVTRRNAMAGGNMAYAPQPAGYGAQPMAQPGYGPGYSGGYPPGYGPAPGGGLMRTGLAAAGGLAAGMLVEKMIDGHREGGGYLGGNEGNGYVDNGAGQAATELENRPIDFGSGNGWGGDGGGSSDDFSPSGDDSGGGW